MVLWDHGCYPVVGFKPLTGKVLSSALLRCCKILIGEIMMVPFIRLSSSPFLRNCVVPMWVWKRVSYSVALSERSAFWYWYYFLIFPQQGVRQCLPLCALPFTHFFAFTVFSTSKSGNIIRNFRLIWLLKIILQAFGESVALFIRIAFWTVKGMQFEVAIRGACCSAKFYSSTLLELSTILKLRLVSQHCWGRGRTRIWTALQTIWCWLEFK